MTAPMTSEALRADLIKRLKLVAEIRDNKHEVNYDLITDQILHLLATSLPEKFPLIEIEGMDNESACGAKMWNSAIKDIEKLLGGGDNG